MEDTPEVCKNWDFAAYLQSLPEEGEAKHEKNSLVKGISLLESRDFSAAKEIFNKEHFSEFAKEAEAYRRATEYCTTMETLELAAKLAREGDYRGSWEVVESIPNELVAALGELVVYRKRVLQADCLLHIDRMEDALELLSGQEIEEAIEKSGPNSVNCKAENFFNIGVLHKHLEHYAESLQMFDKCEVSLGESVSSWRVLLLVEKSECLALLQKYSEVIPIVSSAIQALEENPCSPSLFSVASSLLYNKMRCLMIRGHSFVQLNRFKDALSDLESLIYIAKNENALILSNQRISLLENANKLRIYALDKKGGTCFDSGNFNEALNTYEHALQCIAEDRVANCFAFALRVKMLYNMSAAHMKLGNCDLAERKLTYLIQLLTDANRVDVTYACKEKYLFRAYMALGNVLMERAGMLSENNFAEKVCGGEDADGICKNDDNEANDDQSIQSQDHDLTRSEVYSLALDSFTKAVTINPACIPALYSLGTVNIKLGNVTEASDCFRKVLAMDSEHDNANKALERCTAYKTAVEEIEMKKQEERKAEEEAKEKRLEEEKKKQEEQNAMSQSSPQQSAAFRKFNNNSTPTTSFAGLKAVSSKKNDAPLPSSANARQPASSVVTNEKTKPVSSNVSEGRLVELSAIPIEKMSRPQLAEYLRLLSEQDSSGSNKDAYCHPYSALKAPGPYPPNVSVHRELYLSDEEFFKVFKCSKEEFESYPNWKKISKKKATELF